MPKHTKSKLSPKQMKIAMAAEPSDKITGADFKALKKKPKKKSPMEIAFMKAKKK